jgi:DNA recombination protein RmuC
MFLPTESLYAEVMRRDGLQTDIQQNCHVTIAGPSTLSAILSSFQMGFHMLQLQQKGDEVWKVLANARKEFGTFETLMDKMTADVGRVQGTIDKLGVRTRAINRTLRDVSVDGTESALSPGASGGFDGMLPMLRAGDESAEDEI